MIVRDDDYGGTCGMMAKRQTSRGLDVGVQQYWQSAGARFLPLMLRSKGLWTVSKNVSNPKPRRNAMNGAGRLGRQLEFTGV